MATMVVNLQVGYTQCAKKCRGTGHYSYRSLMNLPTDAQNQVHRDFLACTKLMHSSTGMPQTFLNQLEKWTTKSKTTILYSVLTENNVHECT